MIQIERMEKGQPWAMPSIITGCCFLCCWWTEMGRQTSLQLPWSLSLLPLLLSPGSLSPLPPLSIGATQRLLKTVFPSPHINCSGLSDQKDVGSNRTWASFPTALISLRLFCILLSFRLIHQKLLQVYPGRRGVVSREEGA